MNSYSVYFVDYTIGTDAYEKVTKICRSVGKRVFLIGGAKALQAARGVLEEAIAGSDLEIVDTVLFGEECTYAGIAHLAECALQCKADLCHLLISICTDCIITKYTE